MKIKASNSYFWTVLHFGMIYTSNEKWQKKEKIDKMIKYEEETLKIIENMEFI